MSKSTFTPEKVRELVNALQSNANVDCYERKTYYEIVDSWLEQNPIEPVVVEFSDEQIYDLSKMVNNLNGSANEAEITHSILYWLAHQTFAQSVVNCNNDEMTDAYQASYEDFKKVSKELEQLKLQQPTPNWDDSSANYFQIRECWVDERGAVTSWKLNKQFERPKPTLQKVS